jgi:hypothetical protein
MPIAHRPSRTLKQKPKPKPKISIKTKTKTKITRQLKRMNVRIEYTIKDLKQSDIITQHLCKIAATHDAQDIGGGCSFLDASKSYILDVQYEVSSRYMISFLKALHLASKRPSLIMYKLKIQTL